MTILLERQNDESQFEHHKRLIYGKLVDKTLADYDYSELAPYVYGREYAGDEARKRMYGSKYTLDLLEEQSLSYIDPKDALSEIDNKIIELRKERQKFFDQRTAFNKVVRERARQEELNEILVDAVGRGDLPTLSFTEPDVCPSDNDLICSLNDIHYGADIDNYWTKYNSNICARMMGNYMRSIIEIAERHHSENCYVTMGGDAISGFIHQSISVTNKENVIEQIMGVSELIAEFLSGLSKHFSKVIYVGVSGNHSRLSPNKDNALKDERLDDLIEWYVKARLQNHENILFTGQAIDETMKLINVRGKNYLLVHGDYDGSDSKVQALQTMAGVPLYAVLSGHLHHSKTDEVQGVRTIMSGSFMGMDDFCIQKRIYGHPEQTVCVCDNNGVVCHYNIQLKP